MTLYFSGACIPPRSQTKLEHLRRFRILVPVSQGQNMALTVLCEIFQVVNSNLLGCSLFARKRTDKVADGVSVCERERERPVCACVYVCMCVCV